MKKYGVSMENRLVCSCEQIEGKLNGDGSEGSFLLSAINRETIKGCLNCTDPRLSCAPLDFEGTEVTIRYSFNEKWNPGTEEASGILHIVTDMGELELPYRFTAAGRTTESSMGEIRNLFHFANLARAAWEEAAGLFGKPEFERVLTHASGREHLLYRGLGTEKRNQWMEEFLLSIRKKTALTYRLDTEEVILENIEEDQKIEVLIRKKGWGDTLLALQKDGDFLELEKERLTDTDFMGNVAALPVYLRADRLHRGYNYGKITFTHAYGDVTLCFCIHQNQHHRMRIAIEKRRELKRLRAGLTELFVDFRLKKISSSVWKKETGVILERMRALDERSFLPKLFLAHYHISSQKLMEARWLLERLGKQIPEEKNPDIYAYYLYLTTLIDKDEEHYRKVCRKVEEWYYTETGNWEIAWLWMYLSRELHGNVQKKWNYLYELFAAGIASPVLYAEAVLLLNYQPTLLMELGEVELAILSFGQKKQVLTEEVKGVLQYLALREKESSPRLVKLLTAICETEPQPAMLQSLCSLLIKQDRREKKYFKWYEAAIQKELKITRLFEYYMMSMDRKVKIQLPKSVLLYFSYETDLSYPVAAYLYRYICENQESMEELYLAYAPRMERFVMKQLHAGKINQDLAWLYENLVVERLLTFDNARALEQLLYIAPFPEEDPEVSRLIVISAKLEEEAVFMRGQTENGIRIPGKNCLVLKENRQGHRFVLEEKDYPQPFLDTAFVVSGIREQLEEGFWLSLSLCEEEGGWQPMDRTNEPFFRFLAASEGIIPSEKRQIHEKLLDYYYEEDEMGRLDSLLETCDSDFVEEENRTKLIYYLVARGLYEKAWDFIRCYGPEQMDPKNLVRICNYMWEDKNCDTAVMLWFTETAFRKGKYSPRILEFLLEHYRGSSRQMEAVFRAAEAFEIDAYPICERLLEQILYSGVFPEETAQILKVYVEGGAASRLEAAILSRAGEEYLADRCEMDEYLIRDTVRLWKRGVRLAVPVALAYLKYYALHKEDREQAEEELIRIFFRQTVLKRGLMLPFILEYKNDPGMEILADKAWIFEKRAEGSQLILNYTRADGKGHRESYRREAMEELWPGVFGKDFALFHAEEMKYYVIEEQENKEQLIQSGLLRHTRDTDTGADSRFGRINRMAAGLALEDYERVEDLLEEFRKLQYLTERVFHL